MSKRTDVSESKQSHPAKPLRFNEAKPWPVNSPARQHLHVNPLGVVPRMVYGGRRSGPPHQRHSVSRRSPLAMSSCQSTDLTQLDLLRYLVQPTVLTFRRGVYFLVLSSYFLIFSLLFFLSPSSLCLCLLQHHECGNSTPGYGYAGIHTLHECPFQSETTRQKRSVSVYTSPLKKVN